MADQVRGQHLPPTAWRRRNRGSKISPSRRVVATLGETSRGKWVTQSDFSVLDSDSVSRLCPAFLHPVLSHCYPLTSILGTSTWRLRARCSPGSAGQGGALTGQSRCFQRPPCWLTFPRLRHLHPGLRREGARPCPGDERPPVAQRRSAYGVGGERSGEFIQAVLRKG